MEKGKVELSMGCMCGSFSEQLTECGVKFDPSIMAGFDKDMETLNGLKFRNLFPHGQINKAYDRLAKDVFKHVKGSNDGE